MTTQLHTASAVRPLSDLTVEQVRHAARGAASHQQVVRRVGGRPGSGNRKQVAAVAAQGGVAMPRNQREHAAARPTVPAPVRVPTPWAVPDDPQVALPTRGVLLDLEFVRAAVNGDGITTGPARSQGQVLDRLGYKRSKAMQHDNGRRRALKAVAHAYGIALPAGDKDGPAVGQSVLDDADRVRAAYAGARVLRDMHGPLGLRESGGTNARIRARIAQLGLPPLPTAAGSAAAELAAQRAALRALGDDTLRAAFTTATSISQALETLGHPVTDWAVRWAHDACTRLRLTVPHYAGETPRATCPDTAP